MQGRVSLGAVRPFCRKPQMAAMTQQLEFGIGWVGLLGHFEVRMVDAACPVA